MLPGAIHSRSALSGGDIGPHGDKQAAPDVSSTAVIAEVVATFKEAMSRFPSGVVIATASDEHGKSWGFTASSFSSVSLEPPLVLVCLSKGADCHRVFRWLLVSSSDRGTLR